MSKENALKKQEKFYKHLKTYLSFIGVLVFLKFFIHAQVDFYPIAFWWGFVVVIDYLRTFGWEHIQIPATPQQQRHYEGEENLEEDTFVELKPRQKVKAWREQDLV